VCCPIVPSLDVRPGFVLGEFRQERALLITGDIPGGVTKLYSAGEQRIEFSRLASHAKIRECISSEVVSKDIELFGPGERRCTSHLDGRGRAVRQVGPEFIRGHDYRVIGLSVPVEDL
jgi:hypothetical protein